MVILTDYPWGSGTPVMLAASCLDLATPGEKRPVVANPTGDAYYIRLIQSDISRCRMSKPEVSRTLSRRSFVAASLISGVGASLIGTGAAAQDATPTEGGWS